MFISSSPTSFRSSFKRLLGAVGQRDTRVPFPVEFVTGPDAGAVVAPDDASSPDLAGLLASFIDAAPASKAAESVAVVNASVPVIEFTDVLAPANASSAVKKALAGAPRRLAKVAARPVKTIARIAKGKATCTGATPALSSSPSPDLACLLSSFIDKSPPRTKRAANAPPAQVATCNVIAARPARHSSSISSPRSSPSSDSANRIAACPWEDASPTVSAPSTRPAFRLATRAFGRTASSSSSSPLSSAATFRSSVFSSSHASLSDSITTATSSTPSLPTSSRSSLSLPLLFKKSKYTPSVAIAIAVDVDVCAVADFALPYDEY
ncbi:hypothetical protein HDZ31DRAFT_63102 [Schizophyllum fasciatum]